MTVEARDVEEYYRRAAILATAIRRQATDPGGSATVTDTTSVSSSSVSSVSTQSTQSTQSTASVTSQTSQASVSSRSTASATPTPSSIAETITSDVSSTVSSQYTTTNSMGQVITTTLVIIPTSSTIDSTPSGNSNTGAIVGGVVGGIALIVLAALGIFLRRKLKHDKFEANIFDPDRNVERPTSMGAGPRFDLGSSGGGATAVGAGAAGMAAHDTASHITPYSYGPSSNGPTSTHHGSSVVGQPEMAQAPSSGYYPDYAQNNYAQYPAHPVGVGEHFPNPYAPGYHPAAMAGAGAAGLGMAAAGPNRGQTMSTVSSGYQSSPMFSGHSSDGMSHPGSPPPMPASTLAPAGSQGPPLNPRSAKEREAFARTNPAYAVSNPSEPARTNPSPTPSANRSSVAGPTSPVVVHQDGGRIPVEDEGGNEEAEIPPTYDSIPRGR